MAEGGDSGVKMKEVVSELRGDVADLPLPEPRIKLGPRSRRARARARGTLWAGFPQTSCSTLCQRPGASSSPTQKPAVCSNPDVGRLPVSQLENAGVNNSSSLVTMGCCFSVKKTSGQRSDSSSPSRSPPCGRRSKVTAELRQRTSAVTQHEETEVFRNPKHGVDPTLESDPRVALPRLIEGGEQNAPDGSKPVRSTLVGPPSVAFVVNEASGDQQRPKVDPEPQRNVKKVEEVRVVKRARYQALQTKTHSCCSMCSFDDLGQGQQNQCGATDEPGPSALLQTSVVSTPPPKPDAGLLQCLLVDQMLVFYTSSLTSCWCITIPPPGPDDGLLPTPPGPDYSLLPPPPGPDYSLIPTPPGPDYSILPPPSGPDYDLLPPPPGTDYSLLPTLPGPDYGLLLPPPGPDADLLQYLLVDQMLVYYNTSSCTSCWLLQYLLLD
ncbi:hypothetical protein D4764_13G0008810 [Takifugu flavidus]|uniref:Uncharacterized protein n=1 Tax=Takifugu flavidus TaxID=433684 RepID=A0A5C6PB45_9TELE|nr:hypothetical protein D4764_13G0008810 [Takifugu flavidus]